MSNWSSTQRNVAGACAASWMLDAFDFFILIFVITDLAENFNVDVKQITYAITLTLMVRPIGALIFGRLAEKYGRRPVLMLNVLLFPIFEVLSAWSPTLSAFLIFRVMYGVAMGGIWGVASSLCMETIPDRSRGFMSGIFQAGYPAGYLLASICNFLFHGYLGWRGMFLLGALPILLVPFIYYKVPESPVWLSARVRKESTALLPVIASHWKLCLYLVILMACFNFFSHGTQDLYPTFLKVQHKFDNSTVSIIAICYNISAIIGGVFFGSISEKLGRKRTIMIAAILALPAIPLWAFSSGAVALAIGACIMQVMVQGAWGVIPGYLNELVPSGARAVLPGFVYQLGNFVASYNGTMQATIAEHHDNNYGLALAIVVGVVAVLIAILINFGRETKGIVISGAAG